MISMCPMCGKEWCVEIKPAETEITIREKSFMISGEVYRCKECNTEFEKTEWVEEARTEYVNSRIKVDGVSTIETLKADIEKGRMYKVLLDGEQVYKTPSATWCKAFVQGLRTGLKKEMFK